MYQGTDNEPSAVVERVNVAPSVVRRILWVESHADFSATLARILREDGFEVVSATGPADGLELARAERFDLYFLELLLPGMTGVELAQRIREFDSSTPVLFISARAIDAQQLQATACEFRDCCLEPSDFSTLKQTIHSLLNAPREDDVLRECAGAGRGPVAPIRGGESSWVAGC